MDRERRHRRLAVLLIVGALVLAFGNSFEGRFFLDDTKVIVDNPRMRHVLPWTAGEGLGPRALVDATLALNFATGRLNPADYHAGNLLIHVLTALLLFGLIRRALGVSGRPDWLPCDVTWPAAAAALTWALHPLTGSAVMYVCQRYELMAGLFTVLTLYAVTRGAAGAASAGWRALAVAACLAGMASKETSIVIPLLALAYDRACLSVSWREVWDRRRGLHLALAATTFYLTLPVLVPGLAAGVHDYRPEGPSLSYLAVQGRVIAHYLRLSLWPHPLCLDYGWTAQAGDFGAPWSGAAVAGLTIAAAGLAWRHPRAGFVLTGAGILLIPTSTVFPHTDVAFDHRMYLPLAGLATAWALALAAAVNRLPASARVRGLAFALPALLAGAALGMATHARNRDYHDAVHMWETVLDRQPGNTRAAVCLTAELYARHRDDDAIAIARRTLAQSLPTPDARPDPRRAVDTSQLLNNLGLALLRASRHAEARAAFEQAVTLAPGHVRARLNFAAAALASGDTNAACREVDAAWRLAPRDPDTLQGAGDLLAITGRPAEAATVYRQALAQRPDHPPLRRRLAWLLATCPDPSVRQGAEALRLAQALVAMDGGRDPESLETLAAALAESGAAPRAAQLQARIVASAGGTPARQARLACYQAGKPWRDERLASAPDTEAGKAPP